MKIGELVEDLIRLKKSYGINYPDDNIINLACNIIEKLPDQQMTVDEWLDKNGKQEESDEKVLNIKRRICKVH